MFSLAAQTYFPGLSGGFDNVANFQIQRNPFLA